jgi:2',3'-cyclic-nucleotide 2'-phosphodiesterase (5'-nucleotidase family)
MPRIPCINARLFLAAFLAATAAAEPAHPKGDAEFTLLQTSDLHSHAAGSGHVGAGRPASLGAYARIVAYVSAVRASTAHPVVLVDSGDIAMGTLYDLTLSRSPLAFRFLDDLQYNCATLGNHEFDYRPAGLARMLQAATSQFSFHTPMVASNLKLNGASELAPWIGPGKRIAPTHTETLANGLKVGYLGLMGRNAARDAAPGAPVTFTDYAADWRQVQVLVDALRKDQGCDVVIALSHAGTAPGGLSGEDVDLAAHVTGIDVIASGHTHNPFPNAHPVRRGAWTTQIISAGCYGSNVFRLDLKWHAGALAVLHAANPAMTDANLAALNIKPTQDAAMGRAVAAVDLDLNAWLQPVFLGSANFPDYRPADVATGIYHPVGRTEQPMVTNAKDVPPAPNGLGNLSADAFRAVANALVAQGLRHLPGDGPQGPAPDRSPERAAFDATPFTGAVVASGLLRGDLTPGAPLTFSDLYNVLPLGLSPDPHQALATGSPVVSCYLDPDAVRTLCAMQLAAQAGLLDGELYLNLSGLAYDLDRAGTYAFFKDATALAVLQATLAKAAAGSTAAAEAVRALKDARNDSGHALFALWQNGNVYANALAQLNDPDLVYRPFDPQAMGMVKTNLETVGQVADTPTRGLIARMLQKGLAAVGQVYAFDPADLACTGTVAGQATPPQAVDGRSRLRIAAGLEAILLLGSMQPQLGFSLTPYVGASGDAAITSAATAMPCRLNLTPTAGTVQECKEWLALLLYLRRPAAQGGPFTNGAIGSDYASTGSFLDLGDASKFGPAVTYRNTSYPLRRIALLMQTEQTLASAK